MRFNFLEAADTLVAGERLVSRLKVHDLTQRLASVDDSLRWQGLTPLVAGEAGTALPGVALDRITKGRPKREGGGPVSQLEAWMQAEVVAAGIAAAHETVTSEPVPPTRQEQLREAFTKFALSYT